jgi:predicted AlkP superfamily phosphohydrolase/phosphomutase
MAEKNNAVCSICGKPYHVCMSCKDAIKNSPWKVHTDTVECYKIYQIIHGYSTGVYNEKETKAKLQKVDLSNLNELRDNIKGIINAIMNGNTTKKAEDVVTSNEAKKV